MANKQRGEKSFKIGKKSHKIKLNFNAMAEFEDRCGVIFFDFVDSIVGKPMSLKMVQHLFIASYMEANQCDDVEAEKILNDYMKDSDFFKVYALVNELLSDQLTSEEGDDDGKSSGK